jgi:phosphoglycerol transferase MdoB-like AlkP superfamily enzyme
MVNSKINLSIYYASLFCAIWFVITSAFWPYYLNLFISFPIGILSFILHKKASTNSDTSIKYDIVKSLLIVGILIALISFFLFL